MNLTLTFLIFFAVFPIKTYAYLDPGSGSYIAQLLIAFAASGLFFIRSQLAQLGNFIRTKILRRQKQTSEISPHEPGERT